MDVGKLSFYQFVQHPLGADFMTMLSLNGSLNPDQWDVKERWWIEQRSALQDKLGLRGDQPDWPMYVAWRSKLFMHIFFDLQKVMVINITMLPLEKLVWDLTALRNILIDLKLVLEEDLENPTTYFQKVASSLLLKKSS